MDRFIQLQLRFYLLLSLFIFISIPSSGIAQQVTRGMSSAGKADIEVIHSQNVVPAGSEFRVAVLLNLEEDWHVNANVPSMEFLIGTELNIEEIEGLRVVGIQYPEPVTYAFDFAEEPVDVYEGEAPIFITLFASGELEAGKYELASSLRLQACDNEVCLAPTTVDLVIPIEVTAPGTGFQPLNVALFEGVEAASGSITDILSARGGGEIAAIFDTMGWFWAFAGIFLIGLALNLTPCVYPMLSVTVSLFGSKEGEASTLRYSFFMASIYVLGIVSMYSVLGVAAAYTGALFGSWLQSPWVLAGIGVLILLLALSMFGLYELQPPSSWMQKLSGTQRKTGGVVGHFFSGLVVGIFAAPCIGPPIIALLAFVGSQGDPLFGFLLFFIMAFGLGFPYLILGTFSGLLSKLPKSGTWMVWVKKIFGVVLVGVALFYLALAFYPAYTLHAVIATLFAGGIYLGFLERSGGGQKGFTRIKWAVGLVCILLGGLLFQNLQKAGIIWEPYTDERYESALENGTPVMMDFYADWCIPCLELERVTFTDPDVMDATQEFTRLKVDMTQYDSERSEALREQFDIAGVPTIVFINSNGEEVYDARVVGFLRPDRFLERV
ncbi:MAG: cytochrome c biogenesis protein CcdA, partial [Balneolaceae bacterium]